MKSQVNRPVVATLTAAAVGVLTLHLSPYAIVSWSVLLLVGALLVWFEPRQSAIWLFTLCVLLVTITIVTDRLFPHVHEGNPYEGFFAVLLSPLAVSFGGWLGWLLRKNA